MQGMPSSRSCGLEARVLAGRAHHEDAVVLTIPPGRALVQTVDILAPIVNHPYAFGKIAAANALSDVYAMGGEPWSAMSVAFFPQGLAENDPSGVLTDILRGSLDTITEAGAVSAGGHTVADDELRYGLAVTGIIDPAHIARNDGLVPGDRLLLTKPLGTGILSTGVKARWEHAEESEQELVRWCSRLNRVGASAIRECGLAAATDITGFGLCGHALEMAQASGVCILLHAEALPLMPHVLDYARDGLIPAGSHANHKHWRCSALVADRVDEAVEIAAFDAQTSGGLLLAVPPARLDEVRRLLLEGGDMACEIGEVAEARPDGIYLVLD